VRKELSDPLLISWTLTEVLLKAAPQWDLNLWPSKHEAALLPKLLGKILSWWVESNWPWLAFSQDSRENSYFYFEVQELVGVSKLL
jgi:hypothetical protein